MASVRFELEWAMPQDLGLMTRVTLYERRAEHRFVQGVGFGPDEADALLDLWLTLNAAAAPEGAIAHVATTFTKWTGYAPVRPLESRDA